MPTIEELKNRLRIPAMVSPLFLCSGPDMVVETCKAGVVGTFPALNQRTAEGYGDWLKAIKNRLAGADAAPFAAQLSPHRTNLRSAPDLELSIKYQIPILITTLAISREITDAVHSYGGLVFHDATTIRHAQKAIEANVDAVIAVAQGAGGHSGDYNPFAFLAELKQVAGDKAIILAGGISDGRCMAGAIVAGADFVSLGTCFVPTVECMASKEQKQMVLESTIADIVYTDEVSGIGASFLRQTLENFKPTGKSGRGMDVAQEITPRLWRDYWSAGQGVGGSNEIRSVRGLCERLEREYYAALDQVKVLLEGRTGHISKTYGSRTKEKMAVE